MTRLVPLQALFAVLAIPRIRTPSIRSDIQAPHALLGEQTRSQKQVARFLAFLGDRRFGGLMARDPYQSGLDSATLGPGSMRVTSCHVSRAS